MADSKSQATGAAAAKSLKGTTVTLGVQQKVKAESLHRALDEIFRLSGCTSCGLNGFDIHFHAAVNPAIDQLDRIGELDGIRFADIRESNILG